MKISIVIPAHNESGRIGRTLEHYAAFFSQLTQQRSLNFEIIVVLNGCKDNTIEVVKKIQQKQPAIRIIDLKEAGKGLAIIAGFKDALLRDNNFIGFVDADMATAPQYFYELIEKMEYTDGIIASRYMRGSHVSPARPVIKEWGRILIYNPLIRFTLGIRYKDLQCGAKLFKRTVIEKITPLLNTQKWVFDVELLYLCKLYGFTIKEIPTVWHDQDDSKFKLGAGLHMLSSLFKIRRMHADKVDRIK